MIRLILIAGILTLLSCTVRKAGGNFVDEDGYNYYVQPAPQMQVQLYGDYKFHSLKRKHFSDVDKRFLKYAGAKTNSGTPKLMYAAHTFVYPFYSTIGLLYKGQHVHDHLFSNIRQQLQGDLNTTFNTVDSFYTNIGTAYYFSYPVRHAATGTTTLHREYLINNQQDLIRFHFWTTNADTNMVFREAEAILKNIKS